MLIYNDIVVKEFEALGTNGRYHVRLVKNNKNESTLDIREYVESDTFKGYTRKGVRLGWDDIQILLRILPEVENIMDKEGQ